MSNNIARIGFEADTKDLKTAEQDLDALVPAAGRAGQASDTLSGKMNRLGDTLSSKVTAGFGVAKLAMVGFASGILAAFSVGAIMNALSGVADKIDDISKAASKLQVNMGDLQGLGLAADLAGVSFDQLSTIANKMNKVIGQAILKGKENAGVFKLLGISAKELAALPIDERFGAIADRMNSMNLTADQTQYILTQLGDRAGALAPLFEGGSAAIQQASDQLERFNGKLTNDQGKEVERMNDAFTSLGYAIQAASVQFVAFVAPKIAPVIEGISELVGWFNRSQIAVRVFGSVAWAVFNTLLLGIPNLIASLVSIWPKVSAAAKTAANFIINAVTGMYGYIKTILSGVPQIFMAAFYGGASMALKAINDFVQGAIKLFNSLAQAVGDAFGAKLGNMVDPKNYDMSGNAMFQKIQDRAAQATENAKGVFTDANAALSAQMNVDNFSGTVERTKDDLVTATPKVTDFGNALEKTGGQAKSAAEKLTELQTIGKELDKLGAPFDQAKSAFDKLTELQKNGIITGDQYTAMLGRIQAAFISAGGTADQWSKIIANKTNDMTAALKDFSTNALTSVGDTLADLAVDGKADFKALADGIIKDAIRMAWQMLIVKPIIGSVFGFAGGGMFGTSGAGATGFADGGTFTNKVYNRPTPFRFASGGSFAAGVMGEAGPEAVVPLKRGVDGSLGIEAHGGKRQGANQNVMQIGDININTQSTGDAEADKRNAQMNAEAMKIAVTEIAAEYFQAQTAYGGSMNPRGVRNG